MKQITNASELIEGQKYLIELEYRYDEGTNYPHDFYNNNNNKDDNVCFSINNELKNPQIDKLTIYEKQEIELPVIGKYYEFSDDGVGWYKGKLKGYVSHNRDRVFDRIRNETINQKELEAIEYLMFLGYKVEK